MKIIKYADVKATRFDDDQIKGVAGRVVIGKNDGANIFCMRISEISSRGKTPKHAHDWEHEIFFHAGNGEVYSNGQWKPVKAGSIAFIPNNEEHQIRNAGKEPLVFACLIPSKAPDL